MAGRQIQGQSRKWEFWSQYGIQPEQSSLEKLAPALNVILGRPYDIPYSKWKGLG
jgi:hypothetical protein